MYSLIKYLIGTGGWAYFNVPNRPHLDAYSNIFNFVEINYTFYEYPKIWMVERWRRTVPKEFTFAVRCHQDLTHRIGLKAVGNAYQVLDQMLTYCEVLQSPFLVLETPANYAIGKKEVKEALDFFSSVNLEGVRIVWEVRASITSEIVDLIQDLNIVHCVDLSREKPKLESDIVYSRLFGKGIHNIYQFVDDELVEIDRAVESSNPQVAALSFHGIRMNIDAGRFMNYKKTEEFIPITPFTGVNSIRATLSADADFPSSKSELMKHQGWKVIDLTRDKRIHLSEVLSKIPEKNYISLEEVTEALELFV